MQKEEEEVKEAEMSLPLNDHLLENLKSEIIEAILGLKEENE